jgi:hypothetical protein
MKRLPRISRSLSSHRAALRADPLAPSGLRNNRFNFQTAESLSSSGIAVQRTASLPLAYDRTIQYAAAARFNFNFSGILDPRLRGDDEIGCRHTFAISRRDSPEFCQKLLTLRSEGAGNTGCTLHPRSRVQQCTKQNAHEHTGSAEAIRHSLRNGFNSLYRALPGDRALLPPSPALPSANLMPASGHQDHTSLPSASVPFVKGTSASTASRPTSVTIAKRPSKRGGMAESIRLIWPRRQQKIRKFRNISYAGGPGWLRGPNSAGRSGPRRRFLHA